MSALRVSLAALLLVLLAESSHALAISKVQWSGQFLSKNGVCGGVVQVYMTGPSSSGPSPIDCTLKASTSFRPGFPSTYPSGQEQGYAYVSLIVQDVHLTVNPWQNYVSFTVGKLDSCANLKALGLPTCTLGAGPPAPPSSGLLSDPAVALGESKGASNYCEAAFRFEGQGSMVCYLRASTKTATGKTYSTTAPTAPIAGSWTFNGVTYTSRTTVTSTNSFFGLWVEFGTYDVANGFCDTDHADAAPYCTSA